MKQAIAFDFSKYHQSIKQIFSKTLLKRLAFPGAGLVLALLLFFFTSTVTRIFIVFLSVPLAIKLLQEVRQARSFDVFINETQSRWIEKSADYDWEAPENILYEDDKKYYLKDNEKIIAIRKQNTRNFPSEMKGMTLIVGENASYFSPSSRSYPILIVYCDTTNIKPFNLAKKQTETITHLKWLKFRNRVLKPVVIGLVLLLIALYLLGFL